MLKLEYYIEFSIFPSQNFGFWNFEHFYLNNIISVEATKVLTSNVDSWNQNHNSFENLKLYNTSC
jgi:hypothetical protein